jgi:hypothetical protein
MTTENIVSFRQSQRQEKSPPPPSQLTRAEVQSRIDQLVEEVGDEETVENLIFIYKAGYAFIDSLRIRENDTHQQAEDSSNSNSSNSDDDTGYVTATERIEYLERFQDLLNVLEAVKDAQTEDIPRLLGLLTKDGEGDEEENYVLPTYSDAMNIPVPTYSAIRPEDHLGPYPCQPPAYLKRDFFKKVLLRKRNTES